MLGRHVQQRAQNLAVHGHGHIAADKAGQSKVGDMRTPVLIQENVGRFQVAMNDPFAMGVLHGITDLGQQIRGFPEFQLATACQIRQRDAVDPFTDDQGNAGIFVNTVDGDDLRVAQASGVLSFANNPLPLFGVLKEPIPGNFHRHNALQLFVPGFVNGAKTPLPQYRQQGEVPDGLASQGRNGLRSRPRGSTGIELPQARQVISPGGLSTNASQSHNVGSGSAARDPVAASPPECRDHHLRRRGFHATRGRFDGGRRSRFGGPAIGRSAR